MTGSRIHFVAVAIITIVTIAASKPATAALITFSGLNNGVNTTTDPGTTGQGTPVPSNYQPLLNAYTAPGGNVNGSNIGVTITWGTVAGNTSAALTPGTTTGSSDHTYSVNSTDTAGEDVYDSGNLSVTVFFSRPITLPSFFFAYHQATAAPETAMFKGYTLPGDTTPAVTFTGSYPGSTGLAWQQATGFGSTPLEQVTFLGNTVTQMQIDDLTVNVVPEPAGLSITCFAAVGLLACGRSCRRNRADANTSVAPDARCVER